jgi:hypothetical protein
MERATTTMDRMRAMFAMQLPTTLPYATPPLPISAAIAEVANSGAVVARLTRVRPIKALETPSLLARAQAESTKEFPPTTISARPATRANGRRGDITLPPS